MDIENIRDIRIATKGLMGIPQHFLQDDVLAAYEGIATRARARRRHRLPHPRQRRPAGDAARREGRSRTARHGVPRCSEPGRLAARGQHHAEASCSSSASRSSTTRKILPYYFYMCDMIPNAEHWRLGVWEAQQLQHDIMGYLPGFATPRIVCDVPFVGKRWVHQLDEYDRERGITYWTKNYRTGIEADDPEALKRRYQYYDPIYTLPDEGQQWWRAKIAAGVDELLSELQLEQGITVDA